MSFPGKEPVFGEPWQAQLFALTVHLNETGHFDWSDWANRFSATLAAHGQDRDLDGGTDYFTAWLATLEHLLAERDIAPTAEVTRMRRAWETTYLNTPHGAPVHLGDVSS